MGHLLLPLSVLAISIFMSTPSFGESRSVAETNASSIDSSKCEASVQFGPVRMKITSSITYSSRVKDLQASIDGDVRTFIVDEDLWDDSEMRERFISDADTRPSQLSLQIQLREEGESKVAILANHPAETAFYYLDASKFGITKECRASASTKPKKR